MAAKNIKNAQKHLLSFLCILRFFAAAIQSLVLLLVHVGCEKPQQLQNTKRNLGADLLLKTEAPSVPQVEAPESFELYSTLAGKMARMEELLNAVDRFLDDPDFHDRLCADAEEFHQLLTESRGLYPKKLSGEDQPKFDDAADRTIVASKELLGSLRANNIKATREALNQLGEYRQKAHSEFSK
jgi:hypothetical protein